MYAVLMCVQVQGRSEGLQFSLGEKEEGITFEISTSTFTKKTNRCFSIIYTGQGKINVEGKLHLITAVYSLQPLDRFTSLKEIVRSFGIGLGRGSLLIFIACLAQFSSTCPPHFVSVTDSSFCISLFDEGS